MWVLLEKLIVSQLVKKFPPKEPNVSYMVHKILLLHRVQFTFQFPILRSFQRIRPSTRLCVTFRNTSGFVPVADC
jgi:hypothetical protein